LVNEGRPVLSRRNHLDAGFTILEAMMTIAVFAILVALGVPSMKTWIYNNRVRAVADALQNGVRLAQTESLRRSRQVVFSLTNSPTPQTALTAATDGNYWSINVIPFLNTDNTTTGTFVQSGALGSLGSGTPVTVTGPAEICFNSLGRLVTNNPNTGVPGGSCSTLPPIAPGGTLPTWVYQISLPGADRQLNVEVGLGGQVHLCVQNVVLSSSNPDGC
jgi:type IV fimbrial biogenesis protein FimT